MTEPEHVVAKKPEPAAPTGKPAVKPTAWGTPPTPKVGVSLAEIQKNQLAAKTMPAWKLTPAVKKESSAYETGPVGTGGTSKGSDPGKAAQQAKDVTEIKKQFGAWLIANKDRPSWSWEHGGASKKFDLDPAARNDLLGWANGLNFTPGTAAGKKTASKDVSEDQFTGLTGWGSGDFEGVRQFKIIHRTHFADKNQYGEKKLATFHISLADPG
jgi:hypothetical protein